MVYKVIQWGAGSIDPIAIRHFAENPTYELVGVYVASEDEVARDAGELVGIAALGVLTSSDKEALLALDADVVNYAPLNADLDEVCTILRSGKNLVTPSAYVFPKALGDGIYDRLQEACLAGGTSVHSSEIHPGFAGDLLPLTMVRLAHRVDQIQMDEFADMSNHPSRALCFDGLGFGRTQEDALINPSPLLTSMCRIFLQSMHMVATGLGVTPDRDTYDYEVAGATKTVDLPAGTIEQGHVAAMRGTWQLWSGDKAVVQYRSTYQMGHSIDKAWGDVINGYSIRIIGEPSTRIDLSPIDPPPGGDNGYWGRIWATMCTINTIPAVCDAAPGVRTHLDLPFVLTHGLVR